MAEPMAWPPRDDEALASVLAEVAQVVSFPSTPRIAQAVAAQLRERPPAGKRSLRLWSGWRLGRSAALALVALLILAAAAVAFGIAIGGLRITFAPGTPPPLPSGEVQSRAFGSEVGLDKARLRAGFTILVPSLEKIGRPDHVYINDVPSGGTVSLVWGPDPGYPADINGIGLVVTEFEANVDPRVWEKMVYEGTTVTRTLVGGETAFWISGGEHTFFYRDASGRIVDSSLRLVGTALIWQQHGLVLRVEGAPDLPSATDVADSLR
jgi:hypothetical protein